MDSHPGGALPVGALDDAAFGAAVKYALKSGLGCKPTIVVDVVSDPN